VQLIASFNAAAAGGWLGLEATARPADGTCRHCPARLRCEPYWRALRSDWLRHGSARGVVAAHLGGGAGDATIAIETESPRDRAGLRTVIYQVPLPKARMGASIAIVDADERGDPAVLRFRWDTDVEAADEPASLGQ
jgi:hypothetical protein